MSRYENYEIKNNVFGTLSAPISSLATTIQLWDWQGQRFSVNQLATLENIENWKVMKREIVLITAINWDVLTVERKYTPCPSNDDANTQSQVSYAFSADDTISVYITKEHFDNIEAWFENTNLEIDWLNIRLESNDIESSYWADWRLVYVKDLINNITYTFSRYDDDKIIEIWIYWHPKKRTITYWPLWFISSVIYA